MFLVLIIVNPLFAAAVDWCSYDMQCPETSFLVHTMCRFKDELETPRCTGIVDLQSDANRHLILQLHNEYRKIISMGEVPGWPPASNMKKLRYSKTLEKVAFRWATQCWPDYHDWCRKTQEWSHVGQNIAHEFSSTPVLQANPASDVKAWWEGIRNTNSSVVEAYSSTESFSIYFTQMIWATTEELGCAMVAYKLSTGVIDPYTRITVCNYGPGGNVVNYPVYLRGEPCSRCQPGECVCEESQIEESWLELPVEEYGSRGLNVNSGIAKYFPGAKVYSPIFSNKTVTPVYSAEFGTRAYWCSDELTCYEEVPQYHTMCLYKNEVETPRCTGIVDLMTDCVRERIVRSHNFYRRKIAVGEVPGWPTATNMRALTYDKTLEDVAYRWATQCWEDHDKCRKMEKWYSVGQNIARSYRTRPWSTAEPEEDIEAWWDEINDADPQIVDSFYVPVRNGKRPTGHFVQLIWANTDRIGCAMISYKTTKPSHYPYVRTLICNYGTGGNILSYPVYEKGFPCSKCPANMCVCDLEVSEQVACNNNFIHSKTRPYKTDRTQYLSTAAGFYPISPYSLIGPQFEDNGSPLARAHEKFWTENPFFVKRASPVVSTEQQNKNRITYAIPYLSYTQPWEFTSQPFHVSRSYYNLGSNKCIVTLPSELQGTSRTDLVQHTVYNTGPCIVQQGLLPPYVVAYKRPNALYVADSSWVKPEWLQILSDPRMPTYAYQYRPQ